MASRRLVAQTEVERGVGEILIDEERSQARIRELGGRSRADYAGRELLLVGVLKGAVFFMADLMRSLTVPCEIDFMAISSYGAPTDSSGRRPDPQGPRHQHRGPPRARRRGHHRLRPDALLPDAEPRVARAGVLEICALLTKPERREIDVPVRCVGFEIPNKFVIGYGLDFAERYRNLPLRRRVSTPT